jgi:hypothetical protein
LRDRIVDKKSEPEKNTFKSTAKWIEQPLEWKRFIHRRQAGNQDSRKENEK